MRIRSSFFFLSLGLASLWLCACSSSAPSSSAHMQTVPYSAQYYVLASHADRRFHNESQPAVHLQDSACDLLAQRPHWRRALQDVKLRWNMEPAFILAFLHQESRFNPTALSSSFAYGYAQIKDDSWDWYLLKTQNKGGGRERFDDAVDFIGFYANQNVKRNRVQLNDVKNQYLAYHEGMGGFESGSYLAKPWLLTVSDKVRDRASFYQAQLLECPI